MVFRLSCLLTATLLAGACATRTALPSPLRVDETEAAPFDRAFWSVHVEDDAGQVLYSRNADKLMIPASNRKLFTAATVESCLGAHAQLETTLLRDGDDLVLRGGGDPSLGSWRHERDGDFDQLAMAVRDRGITHVRDIIVDVSAFDRLNIPGSWKYGNLGSDYAAPVDAIAWGENELPGDRATSDPPLHAGNALREALLLRGVAVSGVQVSTMPRRAGEVLVTVRSPFVMQLLESVLKNSHNLYAEMLLKRVGGGTYEQAFVNERAFLTGEVRLQDQTFRFVDGSGLAPDDLVTARSVVAMLRWMNEPQRRGLWWAVLAQPNNDGTLRRRLVTLEDRMRGKTGTVNGVAALSGILKMPDDRFRYFSITVNHHTGEGSDAVKIIDAIVARFAEP